MASSPDSISMALFCDFENVALGVRDAKYDKFDIKRVLERLLLKGSIVVKKAYCDWDRYKSFKAAMHEANFELIEIPHVRQSGKNSADIRLVVDALDLCYTKSHVDTFVIISGDSDFSPLVSKLRENAKQVIGVGVKQSTSDLLIANCDEFIFYDDLVRDSQRAAAKREARDNPPAARRSTEEDKARREELESRRSKAIDIAVETFEALLAERGESGKIWSSMLKEAIKRRKPDFNESYFGFRAFGNLLEEAQARGLLELGRDEKSGIYVNRPGPGAVLGRDESTLVGEAPAEAFARTGVSVAAEDMAASAAVVDEETAAASEPRRGRTRGRGRSARPVAEIAEAASAPGVFAEPVAEAVPSAGVESGAHAEHAGPAATSAGAARAVPVAVAQAEPATADAAQTEARPPNNGRSRRGTRRGSPRGRAAEGAAEGAEEGAAAEAGGAVDVQPGARVAGGSSDPGEGGGEGVSKPASKSPSRSAAPRRRAATPAAKVTTSAKTAAKATPAAEAPPPARATPAAEPAPEPAVEKPAARPRRARKPKSEPAA